MMPRSGKGKKSDQYQTDSWIIKIFENWFDPCPLEEEFLIDGLSIPWKEKTYVNPPYSNPLPWVEKAIFENLQGNTIALLLKHDSSTKWYKLLHEAGADFLLIHKRLKFNTGKSCAFPSIIAILEGY